MALHPIDLQTLYSQLNNVSKNIASQQQVAQLRDSVLQEDYGKKITEKEKSVKETAKDETDTLLVNDRNERRNGSKEKKREKNQAEEAQIQEPVRENYKEPGLGRYIDIQG